MMCLSGDAGGGRELAAVLIFRRVVALGGDLDADGAVLRVDLGEGARLHAALGGVEPQSEGGGLGENDLRERLPVLDSCDDAEAGCRGGPFSS